MTRLPGLVMTSILIASVMCARADAAIVLGARGGVTFARQNIDANVAPEADSGTRTGMAIGASVEFEVVPVLWLRLEPMYVQRGGHTDWSGVSADFTNTQKYDYFAVPVNLVLKGNMVSFRPYVFSGVTPGWAVNDKIDFDGFPTTDAGITTFDLGLDIGVGADFPLVPRVSIGVDARYTFGVTDNTDTPAKVTNRTGLILAGVNFTL